MAPSLLTYIIVLSVHFAKRMAACRLENLQGIAEVMENVGGCNSPFAGI